MLSPYVEKRLTGRETIAPRPSRLRLIADPALAMREETLSFLKETAGLGFEVMTGGDPEIGDLPLWLCPERDQTWAAIEEEMARDTELGLLWLDSDPGPAAAFQPESLALLGLRTATKEQSDMIRRRQVVAYTMEDVDLIGIREVMRRALRQVTSTTDGFMMVLDASVGRGMEPDDMEAGLSYRECSTAMELVAASEGLRAIAVTGFEPDARSAALKAAFGYLLSALGKRILR
jgi:hypothetical protein